MACQVISRIALDCAIRRQDRRKPYTALLREPKWLFVVTPCARSVGPQSARRRRVPSVLRKIVHRRHTLKVPAWQATLRAALALCGWPTGLVGYLARVGLGLFLAPRERYAGLDRPLFSFRRGRFAKLHWSERWIVSLLDTSRCFSCDLSCVFARQCPLCRLASAVGCTDHRSSTVESHNDR